MPSGKKQTKGVDKRAKINEELFQFQKCVESGFPNKCSAIAYDEQLKLLAIGTKTGLVKIYGQVGVEFVGRHAGEDVEVIKMLFVPAQARLITFCSNYTVHLWEVNFDPSSRGVLEEVRSVALADANGKPLSPSALCVSHDAQTLFIGTESSLIYILRISDLSMAEAPLRPDILLASLPKKYQSSPGSVEGLTLNPQSTEQLLIAYSHGLVVSCSLNHTGVGDHQVSAAYHCDGVTIQSLSAHHDGDQIVTAHEDGSYVYWHLHPKDSSTDEEASDDDDHSAGHVQVMKLKKKPTVVYGPSGCKPITKVAVKSSDKGDMLMLVGGMPRATYNDKYTVSVIRGSQHATYDLTSKVIDFVVVDSQDLLTQYENPEMMLILAEEELVAIDLQSAELQQTPTPYMSTIHSSAITFSAHFANVNQQFFAKMKSVGEAQLRRFNYSIRGNWPITGGRPLQQDLAYCARDLFVTGHESGAVNFWDASSPGSVSWLCKLSTAKLFKGEFADAADGHVDENEPGAPPFRKVGIYDPYSDDPRLAVQKVVVCGDQQAVAVGGAAGQVMVFQISDTERDNVLPIAGNDYHKCNIVEPTDKFSWKGWEALPLRDAEVNMPAGFQPTFLVELNPPAAVSALEFNAAWNVIVAGTAHGYAVIDVAQRKSVVTRCTLNLADELARQAAQAGPMQRMRSSLKKSLRQSVRRMRRARESMRRSMRRKGSSAADKKGRMASAGGKEKVLRSQSAAEQKPDAGEVKEVNVALVRSALLVETYVGSNRQRVPTVIAATNGGVMLIHTLTVPAANRRTAEPIKFENHKDLVLQHKAPIVHLAVVRDPDMAPVGSDASAPNGPRSEQHYLLVFSEEQIKLFSLPHLKAKCKAKLKEVDGQEIRKATIALYRTRQGALDDVTENAALVLTNEGELRVYHVDSHAIRCDFQTPCIKIGDLVGINSCCIGRNAHGYYHSSPSEFMRFSTSKRNQQAPRCSINVAEPGRVLKNLGRPVSTALQSNVSQAPRVSTTLPFASPGPASPTYGSSGAAPHANAEISLTAKTTPSAQSAPPAAAKADHPEDGAAVYYSMPPDLPAKARTSAAKPPAPQPTAQAHEEDEDEEEEEEEDSEEEGEAELHGHGHKQSGEKSHEHAGKHNDAGKNGAAHHHAKAEEDDEEEEEEDDDDV